MISNRVGLARVWQMAACSWKTRRSRIMPSYMRIHAYYSSDTLGRQAAWRSLPPPGEGSGSPDASPLPEWHVSRVHAQTSSNAFVWLWRGGLRLPAGPSEDSGPEMRRRTRDAPQGGYARLSRGRIREREEGSPRSEYRRAWPGASRPKGGAGGGAPPRA